MYKIKRPILFFFLLVLSTGSLNLYSMIIKRLPELSGRYRRVCLICGKLPIIILNPKSLIPEPKKVILHDYSKHLESIIKKDYLPKNIIFGELKRIFFGTRYIPGLEEIAQKALEEILKLGSNYNGFAFKYKSKD